MYFLSQTQQAYERTLEIPRWQKMSLTITKSLCSEYGIILICLTKAVLLHLSLTRQVVCPDKSNVSRRITVPLWYGHLWHWQSQVGKATRGLTKKVNYVKYSFCFKAVVAVIWIVVWIETWLVLNIRPAWTCGRRVESPCWVLHWTSWPASRGVSVWRSPGHHASYLWI